MFGKLVRNLSSLTSSSTVFANSDNEFVLSLDFDAYDKIASAFINMRARFGSKESKTPTLANASNMRLFIIGAHRFAKSVKFLNFPFAFRSATIASVATVPTPLIAANAYMILPPRTVNKDSLSLISGATI